MLSAAAIRFAGATGHRGSEGVAGRLGDGRSVAPLALLVAVSLTFAPDDASAAVVRNSAAALGALAVFAPLLFVREWPVALMGSIWAGGTVFVAALWFWRTRYRVEWFSFANGLRARAGKSAAGVATIVPPAVGAVGGWSADAVLDAARRCFVTLQAAWDAGDIEGLRAQTTAEMLGELLQELPRRGPGPNRTDVITLDAVLLGFELLGGRYLASVEFSGMICESLEQGSAPFKEVWMLTCEVDEMPCWRLARQQALL